MSKIVAIAALTLDGVMLRRLGGGARDAVMQRALGAHMSNPWSLLLGRITYENFADYWPKQPPNPMGEKMNNVEKFVASATLTEPFRLRF